ncbi:MAG: 3-oxoacyl-[acyl-carrier-protein] reductase [Spirochaetales bacterium]|jgi:3-oxoacyl-[acyl-carrier protein] reductase|nr:3-oxoacyl-[acyl-carrier-protein] reductase [Spirochaetales bacterium]
MLVQGRKVLITGGSRGIGRALVSEYLREGASVWYLGLQKGDFEEYQRIAQGSGAQVSFAECDVADEAALTAAAKDSVKAAGGFDVLVNNAGITRDGLSFRMTLKDWNDVLTTNLTAAFLLSKVVVQDMFMKKIAGAVVNISSIVGVMGNGGQVNYAASKAGLIGFTKSLAREVAPRNIRVNAVAPGFIQTSMTDKLNEEQKTALVKQIPMARLGGPEDVAKAALFLSCDLSSYITGHVLHVTGGLGM